MATIPNPAQIDRAAAILRSGGLVAFPTETVYGLGADARNAEAVARIFAVKGRPQDHPVIVHIPGMDYLMHWAQDIPPHAWTLARRFWPGPLTLIVARASDVPDAVTGGQDTVGLRVPSHPAARALLHAFAGEDGGRRLEGAGHRYDGVAAPSANRFGRISPTTAAHVRTDLGDDVDMVLDGGPCEVGIESTIVDCSRGDLVLLRPGGITAEQIALAAGVEPRPADAAAPRAPGTLAAHYAPNRPLTLATSAQWDSMLMETSTRRAVLSLREQPPGDESVRWIRMPADPARAGHDLYASLRSLDDCDCELILVEAPPPGPQWDGVRDRLSRAATRS